MKKFIQIRFFTGLFTIGLMVGSCHKDLDLKPLNDVTSEKVYSTPEGYKQALSRVYSAYALTGNDGPAGAPDIPGGGDEGFSDFVRGFWNLQELTTDEAVVAWGDAGLPDLHLLTWSSNNGFIRRMYARSFFQIVLCNEFIRNCSGENLSKRGIPSEARAEIEYYKQEARFLRAYQYWVLIDLFGNVPFVKEGDLVGANLPNQGSRTEIFNYIESELLDLQSKLKPAKSNEYGRADAAAAQALLSRISLNAESYLGAGNGKYNQAVEYASKVIASGYSLSPDYQQMMSANNNTSPINSEFIMTVNYDGLNTKGFGGTHYFTHAMVGGDMVPRMFGVNTGWTGLRATKNLPSLFSDLGASGDNGPDKRAMFYINKQNIEINTVATFTDGYAVTKYRNTKLGPNLAVDSVGYSAQDSIYVKISGNTLVKNGFVKITGAVPNNINGSFTIGFSRGNRIVIKCPRPLGGAGEATGTVVREIQKGNDPDQAFVDVDYPLFRLGEMYLIYAEATLRGGAGDLGTATNYINLLRERAYGNTNGNITLADVTLDFILDERGRELYWEGHRRTDLIRFNKFVESTYLWPWKGGTATGNGVADFRKLFPIPVSDLTSNPKLVQNPGY